MISWPDVVNGLFETFAGAFIFLHIRQLYKDKQVKGVSIVAAVFFASWGYWNLFYYPHLDQWISFVGGLGVVTMNTIWCAMMIYYSHFKDTIQVVDTVTYEVSEMEI